MRIVQHEDILALLGEDMDPAYCACGKPVGYAAECDGVLVGIGMVTWDRYGRAWGWMNRRGPIPASIMRRCAVEMLDMLRKVTEPALYMICDLSIPGAERFVRHLGFEPESSMTHPLGPVFKCDLAS